MNKLKTTPQHNSGHLITVQYALPSRAGLPAANTLRYWAQTVLPNATAEPIALTLRIITKEESARLNQRYRNQQGPTNVLSFAAAECPVAILPRPLGDVVICAAIAERESQQQNKTLQVHLAHLTIHGILHLMGYDHVRKKDAVIMENRERAALQQLNIADPY